MAFGDKICACCGSTTGIEDHHLYLKSDGCPDDLTVWLCHVCHGRTHGLQRRMNMSEAVKAGVIKAKERGVQYVGRAPTAMRKMDKIKALKCEGIGIIKSLDEESFYGKK